MSRRIIKTEIVLLSDGNESTSIVEPPDNYTNRLMKLIPGESIAAFTAANNVLKSLQDLSPVIDWIVFFVFCAGTSLYIKAVDNYTRLLQIFITTLSFIVYVFTIGGPFERHLSWYNAQYAVIASILFTFIVFAPPFLNNEKFC
jgi:hypothetical protein